MLPAARCCSTGCTCSRTRWLPACRSPAAAAPDSFWQSPVGERPRRLAGGGRRPVVHSESRRARGREPRQGTDGHCRHRPLAGRWRAARAGGATGAGGVRGQRAGPWQHGRHHPRGGGCGRHRRHHDGGLGRSLRMEGPSRVDGERLPAADRRGRRAWRGVPPGPGTGPEGRRDGASRRRQPARDRPDRRRPDPRRRRGFGPAGRCHRPRRRRCCGFRCARRSNP